MIQKMKSKFITDNYLMRISLQFELCANTCTLPLFDPHIASIEIQWGLSFQILEWRTELVLDYFVLRFSTNLTVTHQELEEEQALEVELYHFHLPIVVFVS